MGGGRRFGLGEAVVVVAGDGMADASAPAVPVEGIGEFVLGEMDGLQESLGEIGEGGGGFGFDLSIGDGGEEAGEGETEIAGGDVFAGKEESDIVADLRGGLCLGFLASVEETEMRMAVRAGSAATAAVGEGEGAEGRTVLGAECRHGSSPKICKAESGRRREEPAGCPIRGKPALQNEPSQEFAGTYS